MRYIRAAIAAGGVITMQSPMIGKSFFSAKMDWPAEDPVIGGITMDPIRALEKLEKALEEDANE